MSDQSLNVQRIASIFDVDPEDIEAGREPLKAAAQHREDFLQEGSHR